MPDHPKGSGPEHERAVQAVRDAKQAFAQKAAAEAL